MAFWHRTKTGRLKFPSELIGDDCARPTAVGDYVHIYSTVVGAGTIGKVIEFTSVGVEPNEIVFAQVLKMDGKVESACVGNCLLLDQSAIDEVMDWFAAVGKSSHIKGNW